MEHETALYQLSGPDKGKPVRYKSGLPILGPTCPPEVKNKRIGCAHGYAFTIFNQIIWELREAGILSEAEFLSMQEEKKVFFANQTLDAEKSDLAQKHAELPYDERKKIYKPIELQHGANIDRLDALRQKLIAKLTNVIERGDSPEQRIAA